MYLIDSKSKGNLIIIIRDFLEIDSKLLAEFSIFNSFDEKICLN